MKNGQKKKKGRVCFSKKGSEIFAEEEKCINNESFRDCFKYQNPSRMYENLNRTENTERIEIQVDLTKSVLTDLKNKIKNISDDGKRIE